MKILIPKQGENTQVVSPLAGWIALTLLYRFWPVGIHLGLGVVALGVWRVRRMQLPYIRCVRR